MARPGSFFYNLQRKLLKVLGKNAIVTVNGNWPNQAKNILGFENPCLDLADRINGELNVKEKGMKQKINYCFVGGLNKNKGCLLLLKALGKMELPKNFGCLHIVGEGHFKTELAKLAKELDVEVIFHGSLPKDGVVAIYRECHFLVLPSTSEGFPKVVGEAMNYGCIPIVSNISCIDQYVEDSKNGLLINPITVDGLKEAINKSFYFTNDRFQIIIENNYKLAASFTYDYYRNRIDNEIFRVESFSKI